MPRPADAELRSASRAPTARLLDTVLDRKAAFRRDPSSVLPWLLTPCRVRILLVADGGLDFGGADFGLATFVSLLLDEKLTYVDFDITLAHLASDVLDEAVMVGAPGITRSIKDFRFDDPDHFRPEDFDQVWLFGIETFYHFPSYASRDADHATYPDDRLSDGELAVLGGFMNAGGGLFATGDHGLLGRNLGGSVTRARSMRLWAGTSDDEGLDEVSMGGPRRNDTNRIGHEPDSRFDDQSDDVPQDIQPVFHTARFSPYLEARWPHPLLCGRRGVISVLPDHPHEGECVRPEDLTAVYPFDGSAEYPPASNGGDRVAPQIVAHSTVPSGNIADPGFGDPKFAKKPTVAHSFGAIAAYDGHRAGIGRVVTDATWHHYVNTNLVGEVGIPDDQVKGLGFLASDSGKAHLEQIANYYRNIAVWISPPAVHRCVRRSLLWALLYQHRVLEAVLTSARPGVVTATQLYEIGTHARSVLGQASSRCLALRILLDLVAPVLPELVPELDPWSPPSPEPPQPFPPFTDPGPLLDIALGGALLALREEFPAPGPSARAAADDRADQALARGVASAVALGVEALRATVDRAVGVIGG